VDRVEEFLDDRLRGRSVPADLRRLVELQLDGVLDRDDCPPALHEVRVLGPGELHPLQEPPVDRPWAPVTDSTLAASRAMNEVLTYVAVIMDGFDGAMFGYWLHPDELPDPHPQIVRLDTEGTFELIDGTTLTQALGLDRELRQLDRIPEPAPSQTQFRRASPAVDPAALFDKLYERENRFRRPLAVSTDDTVPIGIACDDPRVSASLAKHGFPRDLQPLIEAADDRSGEVALSAPACAASVELRQQDATTWYLHLMAFRKVDDDRPPCTDPPFGIRLDETRAQARTRLGEPHWQGAQGNIDSWRFGPLDLHVTYDADDTPLIVRVFPESLTATFRYFG
jgi:hypothetical protein